MNSTGKKNGKLKIGRERSARLARKRRS